MINDRPVYMPSERLLNGMMFCSAELRGAPADYFIAVIFGDRRLAVRRPEWKGEGRDRLLYELPDGLMVRVWADSINRPLLIHHTRLPFLTDWAEVVEAFLKQSPPRYD